MNFLIKLVMGGALAVLVWFGLKHWIQGQVPPTPTPVTTLTEQAPAVVTTTFSTEQDGNRQVIRCDRQCRVLAPPTGALSGAVIAGDTWLYYSDQANGTKKESKRVLQRTSLTNKETTLVTEATPL